MKANDAPDNVGERGRLLTSAYQPLAAYFVKFIEAYKQAGIPVPKIVGTEPMEA